MHDLCQNHLDCLLRKKNKQIFWFSLQTRRLSLSKEGLRMRVFEADFPRDSHTAAGPPPAWTDGQGEMRVDPSDPWGASRPCLAQLRP